MTKYKNKILIISVIIAIFASIIIYILSMNNIDLLKSNMEQEVLDFVTIFQYHNTAFLLINLSISAVVLYFLFNNPNKQDLSKTEDALANDSKTNFLRNISHEIRTPMNGMLGMLELLLNTDISERQNRFVKEAYINCEALIFMMNEILDFTKIESGHMEMENIDFDLHDIINKIHNTMLPHAEKNKVEFTVENPEDKFEIINGDPHRVHQVLLNLVTNAIKFSKKGRVSIKVKNHKIKHSVNGIKVEIKDTGIGIAKDMQSRIFSKFTQADESTTRKYGGTGLGLALSKLLVELMGGKIGVESEVGVGSTFWFTLPLNDKLKNVELPYFTEPLGRKVLLVISNKKILDVFSEYIEQWGVNYIVINSAEAAIEILKGAAKMNKPYQTILVQDTDLDMKISELSHKIKSDNMLSDAELLLACNDDKYTHLENYKEVGYQGYLVPLSKMDNFKLVIKQKLNIDI